MFADLYLVSRQSLNTSLWSFLHIPSSGLQIKNTSWTQKEHLNNCRQITRQAACRSGRRWGWRGGTSGPWWPSPCRRWWAGGSRSGSPSLKGVWHDVNSVPVVIFSGYLPMILMSSSWWCCTMPLYPGTVSRRRSLGMKIEPDSYWKSTCLTSMTQKNRPHKFPQK